MSSLMIRGAATVQPEDALGPSPIVELNFGLGDLCNVCAIVGAAWIAYNVFRFAVLLARCVCGCSRTQPEVSCGIRSHLVDTHDEALLELRLAPRIDNKLQRRVVKKIEIEASAQGSLSCVCVTTYGRYYHKMHCKWLKQSSGFEQIPEVVALQKGFKQCRTCLHVSQVKELGSRSNLRARVQAATTDLLLQIEAAGFTLEYSLCVVA